MKTFGSILIATLLIAAMSAKLVRPTVPRRLLDPVTLAAGATIIGKLAEKCEIKLDANQLVTQLQGIMGSQAQAGAIILNMDKGGKGHNMFMMNDVMNMHHTVYNENYCAHGSACHVYKQWLPFASGKVKVCMDSAWGVPQRTYVVDEGNLYAYDGEGITMVGSIDAWKAGLSNGAQTLPPAPAAGAEPTPAAGAGTLTPEATATIAAEVTKLPEVPTSSERRLSKRRANLKQYAADKYNAAKEAGSRFVAGAKGKYQDLKAKGKNWLGMKRRLQEPATKGAATEILGKLADKFSISLDANKLVDQLTGIFASAAQDGAVVINMDKSGKGHNMFMMNDVMNVNHTLYNENYCANKSACHVYKTKLAFGSPHIKVCMDSKWGTPERTHTVSEGNLYAYDGEGFNMIGSVAKWKEGLKNGARRLSKRRLQDPVTMAAGVEILGKLADKFSISLDANKLVDQLTGIFASAAQDGAVVINMDKSGKGHNMFMMNDVMNFNHTVYNENYCANKAACHVYKTKLPGASGKVKVCMDSNWGIPKRTHIVDEGNLYAYDGEGFNMIGSVAKWKEGLKNGARRLSKRRLSALKH